MHINLYYAMHIINIFENHLDSQIMKIYER